MTSYFGVRQRHFVPAAIVASTFFLLLLFKYNSYETLIWRSTQQPTNLLILKEPKDVPNRTMRIIQNPPNPRLVPNTVTPELPGLQNSSPSTTRKPNASSHQPRLRFSKKKLWTKDTLLNMTDFKWILNNESLCQQTKEGNSRTQQVIPVLIHTARSHFDQRRVIRTTWASVGNRYKNWDVRPVFLLGDSDPRIRGKLWETEMTKIYKEYETFGDLVVGNFVDTYKNLTYKHLMGYKWILNFCPNAAFVVKADDDMFIDMTYWADMRSEDIEKNKENQIVPIPDIYCLTYKGTKPMRSVGDMWYLSRNEWAEEYYPSYCSGHAYGITVDGIRKIYSVSKVNKFVWVDDAYVTGILKREAVRKYGWRLVEKDVWNYAFHHFNLAEWRPFCEDRNISLEHWSTRRRFKMIVDMEDNFERDMNCLWKKVVFDRSVSVIVDKINAANDSLAVLKLLP